MWVESTPLALEIQIKYIEQDKKLPHTPPIHCSTACLKYLF